MSSVFIPLDSLEETFKFFSEADCKALFFTSKTFHALLKRRLKFLIGGYCLDLMNCHQIMSYMYNV